MEWREALAYCEDLEWGGFDDWRLPNIMELRSIVDNGESRPAIDRDAFPETANSFYRSSSPYEGPPSYAWWSVNFDDGHVDRYDEGYMHRVRCVRGGALAGAY